MITVNVVPELNAEGVVFMAKKGYHFTNLTAPYSGWSSTEYGSQLSPTTVLLDQQGRAIMRHIGFSLARVRAIEAGINRLLQQ
jgi:hypothetical protein